MFVSRTEFIRSKLLSFSAHVTAVMDNTSAPFVSQSGAGDGLFSFRARSGNLRQSQGVF